MVEAILAGLWAMVNPVTVVALIFGVVGYARGAGARAFAHSKVERVQLQLTEKKDEVKRQEGYLKQVEQERDAIAIANAPVDKLVQAIRSQPDLVPVHIIEQQLPSIVDKVSPKALANLLQQDNAVIRDWVLDNIKNNPEVAKTLAPFVKARDDKGVLNAMADAMLEANNGVWFGAHDWMPKGSVQVIRDKAWVNIQKSCCSRCGVDRIGESEDVDKVAGVYYCGFKLNREETLLPCGALTKEKA